MFRSKVNEVLIVKLQQDHFSTNQIETIPQTTFAEILENTSNGKTQYSILPVENSLEGSVGESYDLLYSTSLNAIGEIYHRIEHCLIANWQY